MEGTSSRRTIPRHIERKHDMSRLESEIMQSVYAAIVPLIAYELPTRQDAIRPSDAATRDRHAETQRRAG